MYIPFMWCCHPLWRKPGYEIDQEAMDAAKTAIRQYMQQRGAARVGGGRTARSQNRPLKELENPMRLSMTIQKTQIFCFAPAHVADSDYGFKKVDSKMFSVVTWLTQGPLHILRFKWRLTSIEAF